MPRTSRPSPGGIAKSFIVAIVAFVFSLALIFSLAGAEAVTKFTAYVYAKCPGIPGGQYSGGPDYIDIGIDAALVAVFGLFLFLTIRDMRRKSRERTAAAE